MNKFPKNRIVNISLNTKKFKNAIPILYVKPIHINKKTCVFIFCCGLGGTNSLNAYMNNDFYNNHYFVSYDKMSHGNNLNKPSQFINKYLIELDEVVNWCHKQFPNKKVFLLGESWGSAINFLYMKKFNDKINGVINWNMPTRPIPLGPKTFWQNCQLAWREIVTLVTNINLQLPPDKPRYDLLTRNKLLARAMAIQPSIRNQTRLTLSVWRYMRPSFNFLLKNCNNPNYNFLYIQTGQDTLMCNQHISKIEAKTDSKHYLKISTGYHILTMEPNESKILYKSVQKFINKK